MECPKCNKLIDDDSAFCEHCGVKIKKHKVPMLAKKFSLLQIKRHKFFILITLVFLVSTSLIYMEVKTPPNDITYYGPKNRFDIQLYASNSTGSFGAVKYIGGFFIIDVTPVNNARSGILTEQFAAFHNVISWYVFLPDLSKDIICEDIYYPNELSLIFPYSNAITLVEQTKLLFVKKNGKWGAITLLDKNFGDDVIDNVYDLIKPQFSWSRENNDFELVCRKNDKWGTIRLKNIGYMVEVTGSDFEFASELELYNYLIENNIWPSEFTEYVKDEIKKHEENPSYIINF